MKLKVCQREGCYNIFEDDHGQKYCSANCRSMAYYRRKVGDRKVVTYDLRRNCVNCGKLFYAANSLRKYCSGKCRQEHYRQRKELDY
jgi:predicted nucleic acid-binding Zn ribbon protein